MRKDRYPDYTYYGNDDFPDYYDSDPQEWELSQCESRKSNAKRQPSNQRRKKRPVKQKPLSDLDYLFAFIVFFLLVIFFFWIGVMLS